MKFAMRATRLVQQCSSSARCLHVSASTSYPRAAAFPFSRKAAETALKPPPIFAQTGVFLDEDDMDSHIPVEERDGHGSSSLGHLVLRQQRRLLQYMRLIEHDMPKLVRWREDFQPTFSAMPLVVRTIDYGGEEHPVTSKRTVVVPVAYLPLNGPEARHAFRLLAGPRWSSFPPPDSGISPEESSLEGGYVKVSCEDYPQPGMNLKWISDALDRLIAEANLKSSAFRSIPLDTRYLDARKTKKGGIRSSRHVSLRDFPAQWLPSSSPA